jgi:hypothetical protein
MHNLPSRAAVAVARHLRIEADLAHFDDHAAASALGLHRRTVAAALAQLGALGAITCTALPSGPRQRRSGPPVRRVELKSDHWLWVAVDELGGAA